MDLPPMFGGRVSSNTVKLAQRTLSMLLEQNRYGHSAMREIDPMAPFVCLLPELTGRGLVELTAPDFVRVARPPRVVMNRPNRDFDDYVETGEVAHHPV